MLRRLSQRLTYANVVATLALIVAVGGTSAYAANTIRSSDIVDGEVASVDIKNQDIKSADVQDQSLTTFDVSTFLGADIVDGTITGDDLGIGSVGINQIRPNSITTNEVVDGTLYARDISEFHAKNFTGQVGVIPAQSCVRRDLDAGINIYGNHLLLTPNGGNAHPNLSYTVEYRIDASALSHAYTKICNPTASAIDDGTTSFNALAIYDPQ